MALTPPEERPLKGREVLKEKYCGYIFSWRQEDLGILPRPSICSLYDPGLVI